MMLHDWSSYSDCCLACGVHIITCCEVDCLGGDAAEPEDAAAIVRRFFAKLDAEREAT